MGVQVGLWNLRSLLAHIEVRYSIASLEVRCGSQQAEEAAHKKPVANRRWKPARRLHSRQSAERQHPRGPLQRSDTLLAPLLLTSKLLLLRMLPEVKSAVITMLTGDPGRPEALRARLHVGVRRVRPLGLARHRLGNLFDRHFPGGFRLRLRHHRMEKLADLIGIDLRPRGISLREEPANLRVVCLFVCQGRYPASATISLMCSASKPPLLRKCK